MRICMCMLMCVPVRHNASFPALRFNADGCGMKVLAAASLAGCIWVIWSRRRSEPRQRDKLNDLSETSYTRASHPFD
jgi:uncharacterized membrane protein YqjE